MFLLPLVVLLCSHCFVDPECARSKLRKISNVTLEKTEITRLQRERTTEGKGIHLSLMVTSSRVPLSLFLPYNAITQPIWFEFCSIHWRNKPRPSVSMDFFWLLFYDAKSPQPLKTILKMGTFSLFSPVVNHVKVKCSSVVFSKHLNIQFVLN